MSRARKISSDLRHVATLAGTTAAVVEGAAIAAEKARSVTEHLAAGSEVGAVLSGDVDATLVARPCRRKKLLLVLLLGVAAAVGITIWKKRAAARRDEMAANLRDEERFQGSMP